MDNFTFYSPTYFVFGKDQERDTADYVGDGVQHLLGIAVMLGIIYDSRPHRFSSRSPSHAGRASRVSPSDCAGGASAPGQSSPSPFDWVR